VALAARRRHGVRGGSADRDLQAGEKAAHPITDLAFRVLRADGLLAVADVVADRELDPAVRDDPTAWAGCIAGAVTRSDYRSQLADAGFIDIEIIDDHTVADGLSSVFVKARTPASPDQTAAGSR
jgi:arsenite methyltransferase